ncbi:MAG: metallopeptidase family protein [Ignavibacteriales bacterium]|nr:metallopeptidase family protein [Ignavibacteriales bacterium]
MEREVFEKLVEQAFELLPEKFRLALDNVSIVVEDYPAEEIVRKMDLKSGKQLLGLYQGIPQTHRGTWYGMSPIMPDTISLFQKSIERICRDDEAIKEKVKEVLIHELGHYFGMNEEEIKNAGF